jgi:exodeoxyribonuclease-3
MSKFIDSGFIDSFRYFNKEPHQYTWWSYRANARAKNLGWRIDYIMASKNLSKNLKRAVLLPEAKHSDHCPMLLEIDI